MRLASVPRYATIQLCSVTGEGGEFFRCAYRDGGDQRVLFSFLFYIGLYDVIVASTTVILACCWETNHEG